MTRRSGRGEQADPVLKAGTAKPDSRAVKTPIPGQRSVTIKVLLPTWYLKQMDQETALLGHTQRRRFLETLVLWKAGLQNISRKPDAPAVKLPKVEALEDQEYYQWHCPIPVKQRLDELLARHPALNPRIWIMAAMHQWLGLPPIL